MNVSGTVSIDEQGRIVLCVQVDAANSMDIVFSPDAALGVACDLIKATRLAWSPREP